ncbi:Ubiquinone/menaquinone biosynthesis C-methylase UbiE [Tenacibaculum sp. MAR_2009_124]|uniref:class I SAM-dependent methyltransferase n=1 Tax=Tenacibaculum sp. MAR_2009_124 TaxID=1250059 RepID=UPI00089BCCD4|nr:class I SAM-dependent methyltransferase [Tenacibaculum sp. MAR_2009_124]SEC41944.1 Ubiquinone/menaquinone biosynthesis C-methylase UbiE [Tenacibaculum sp. MAR_2009_124]
MQVKYDKIGINYNETRKADKYLTERLIHHLKPVNYELYLDIGCGTGNYTSEMEIKGMNLIGIDPSEEMLTKAKNQNSNVDWRIGSVEKTRLSENSIDGIVATLTIHHWSNLINGFKELNRVLKSQGRIVIFTSTPEQMRGYWLNHYFPKMLSDSIDQMPSFEKVKDAMEKNNISIEKTEKYAIRQDLQDQFLYCGKEFPDLYFNDQIREGISSFSSLANQKEVDEGLLKLKKDVETGHINNIMKSYENQLGDYLFIVGKSE